jgi:hypothetical protein
MNSGDWTLLFQAFAEALDRAFDAARSLARAYPSEVAAVERVRRFVKKRAAGDPAHVQIDDLLFTLGLVAGSLERARDPTTPLTPMLYKSRKPLMSMLAPARGGTGGARLLRPAVGDQ